MTWAVPQSSVHTAGGASLLRKCLTVRSVHALGVTSATLPTSHLCPTRVESANEQSGTSNESPDTDRCTL